MGESKNCINLQIKVYPEEKARFLKIKDEMDEIIKTDRDAFLSLMDFYENPKEIKVDNPDLIKKNQELSDKVNELTEENIQLKKRIEEFEADAENRKQHQANKPENIFEVEVHPVAFHFLRQMAEKTKQTPGYILTDLFIKDLQNPRANNLPYIVASSEIRAKLEEYKKAHPEEYKGKEA